MQIKISFVAFIFYFLKLFQAKMKGRKFWEYSVSQVPTQYVKSNFQLLFLAKQILEIVKIVLLPLLLFYFPANKHTLSNCWYRPHYSWSILQFSNTKLVESWISEKLWNGVWNSSTLTAYSWSWVTMNWRCVIT